MGVLTFGSQRQPWRLAQIPFVQVEPMFSPDGRWLVSLPKTQFDHKERLIRRGVKGSKSCRAVAGSIFDGSANWGRVLFPGGWSLRDISLDSRSGDTPPQCESNSLSRPPLVTVIQSADLR